MLLSKEDPITHTELQQANEGIGIRLRETRLERGLTQEQLAASAGTNQMAIRDQQGTLETPINDRSLQ